MWSDRFLHYHSHHPLNYKINVINNLVDSGIILAQKNFHKENIQKIKSTLLQNNYPLAFVNSVIKKRLNLLSQRVSRTNTHTHEVSERVPNTHIHTTHSNSTGQTPKYVPLPYVQGLSEKLSGILKPFNIKIASRNTNGLSHFFKSTKDPIPKLDTANVVYNIPCSDCTAAYIGTTKRPLKTRIHEHKKDVYNPPEKWTALTKHAWHQDHKFNFDNVKIIDRSDNYKKRMILEMTHIAGNPHAVNQRADTENLSVFYLPLLNDKL